MLKRKGINNMTWDAVYRLSEFESPAIPVSCFLLYLLYYSMLRRFEDGNTGTATRTAAAVKDLASPAMNCLRIWVEDEFDDGWDVAELIVESPNGIKRSYKTECDSVNPLVHRYCPVFHDEPSSKGIHKMYVINGKEAKFNWEILWRVYDEATAKWYLGDVNTEMDFEWQYRDHEFLNTRMHNMRHNLTCTVCPQDETEWYEYQKKLNPEKPKPKAQALQNLRSRALHSRTETSAPSISPAPTIAVDFNKDWNSIEMINDAGGGVTDSWFQGEGWGTFFYISDTKGKKMVYGGSACTAGNVAVSCYVKLDDGDYVLRVTGANDPATLQRRWKFCQGLNYQASQTELYFSVVDGVCFPVMTRHQTLVCDNILKITNLMVEVALSGDYSDLIKFSDRVHHNVNVQQLQPIAAGVSTGLQQIFGFEEHSSSIVRIISSTAAGIIVLVDVGVKGFDESMYDILKTIELGGGQSYRTVVASHVLSSPVSLDQDASVVSATTHVAITSIKIGSETVDHAAEDESAFHEITEFIPQTSTVRSPNELLVKSEYFVALAGYALTLATVIMAIGFLYAKVKQRLNPCDPLVEAAPIKPSVARANLSTLHLVESSSDDESDDGDAKSSSHADGQDEENRRNSTRRKDLSLNGIRNDAPTARRSKSNSRDKLKKLLEDVSLIACLLNEISVKYIVFFVYYLSLIAVIMSF